MTLLPERQNLSDWLRIATWRLSDCAKERIRTEIEAHYSQSVEAHHENGLSESAAQAAALLELGDPEAAGKRFRKQHLTESESEKLEKLDKRARSIWNLLGCYFVFCVFTFWGNRLAHHHSLPLYLVFASLVMVALPTLSFLVARYCKARPNRTALFLYFLSEFTVSPFIFWYFFCDPVFEEVRPIFYCFAILYCAIPTGRLVIYLRLWIKLSKARATNLGQAS